MSGASGAWRSRSRALEKEGGAEKKVREINRELAELRERSQKLSLRWKTERELIMAMRGHKADIDKLRSEAEMAERQGELDRVAEIRYGRIPEIEKKLLAEEKRLVKLQKDGSILHEEISEEDIAAVVSRATGIPIAKMLEKEAEKLVHMEAALQTRVIGQDDAVKAVASAIRRSRAGLAEETKPIGSFIFLGLTGVGKTELAKALAQFLFDDEKALVRVDMSEYMESHSVAKMIGSPPGYVGYEEGGQLTETIRRRPYSVVLFDEIEKAHPDVFNALLQILDDGRLTDSKGRVVNFKNTVIIMTSNVGSDILVRAKGLGFKGDRSGDDGTLSEDEIRERILSSLRERFKPEFLNRIDETIIFHPLSEKVFGGIVDLQLARVVERLAKQGVRIRFAAQVKAYLAKKGYDPAYGARPLKRLIQNEILDPLSLEILEKKVQGGDVVETSIGKDRVVFKKMEKKRKK